MDPPRPPSQVWLQGPASPRSAAPGKAECGRCEGVTPDGKRHPKITVPPHTPDGGLTPNGERHPKITVPPHTPNRRLPPPPLGLPVPRLPSLPLAACSCVCSTSGLLAKTQVGCSTTPCWVWVWEILLFLLPGSLLYVSEVSSCRKPSLTQSLG